MPFASSANLRYLAPMARRKMKAVANIKRVVCRAHHIHWIRGLLIAKERRDIDWKRFRQIFDFSERYVTYLKQGHRVGGRETVRKLIQVCREHGVIIHVSDFYDDDPNQESEKIWQLWSDYTH